MRTGKAGNVGAYYDDRKFGGTVINNHIETMIKRNRKGGNLDRIRLQAMAKTRAKFISDLTSRMKVDTQSSYFYGIYF